MEEVSKHIVPNDVMLGEVRKMIAEGHKVTIKVRGFSMLPFIVGDRDKVLLSRSKDLHTGEIVLAEIEKGRYVLHRVKDIDGVHIVLMGDGNLRGTEQCGVDDVAGKVVKIWRKGKEIDPYSNKEMFMVRLWITLKPVRRWLLAIYRRLPIGLRP